MLIGLTAYLIGAAVGTAKPKKRHSPRKRRR